SAEAIASAVATLGDDFDLAARLALNGRHDAVARFGLTPYRTRIAALLSRVTQAGRSPDDRGLRPSRSPSVRPKPAQSRGVRRTVDDLEPAHPAEGREPGSRPS